MRVEIQPVVPCFPAVTILFGMELARSLSFFRSFFLSFFSSLSLFFLSLSHFVVFVAHFPRTMSYVRGII